MTGFASCPGFLIVTLIVPLTFIPVKTEIWNNEVSDIEYGRLGSNVTLVCSSSSDGPVQWQHNGSSLLSSRFLVQNGNLILINADASMEGNYSCYDGTGLLRVTKLRLGNSPGLVRVTCRAPNYTTVLCSWEQMEMTFLPTKYITTYRMGEDTVQMCHQDSYTLNECIIRSPPIWHHYHVINITEVNPLGSKFTLLKLQIHDIVKPDPPEGVIVQPVPGQPRRLEVKWQYPSSWINEKHFALRFQLRHRPVGSAAWSLVKTTDTNLIITDALAGQRHRIQVQAKDDFDNGDWSEWSPEVEALPWIEPTVTPASAQDSDWGTEIVEESATPKTDVRIQHYGDLGMLISLGLFAGVVLALLAFFVVLIWLKRKGKEEATKQELTSMKKMKSLPI
nr:PREDICTED: interleukin-11 receptor subunit alpha-like [Lepisosteus oculatus]